MLKNQRNAIYRTCSGTCFVCRVVCQSQHHWRTDFRRYSLVNYLLMNSERKCKQVSCCIRIVAMILVLAVMVVLATLYCGWLFNRFLQLNHVPNIFALGVEGLDKGELSMASGLINTLIVGGAVIPFLWGNCWCRRCKICIILSMICYAFIVYYAVSGHKHNLATK